MIIIITIIIDMVSCAKQKICWAKQSLVSPLFFKSEADQLIAKIICC